MNSSDKEIFVTRDNRTVYREGDHIVKLFENSLGKGNIFNAALCHARVEESGLSIPEILSVDQIDGQWAITFNYISGRTLESIMVEDPDNIDKYLEQFVDLQLDMHSKKAPHLTLQRDKMARKIASLEDISSTIRYELNTRLNTMPNHTKLCHGDFNPSNIIVSEDGKMTIIDWSHATQGNASCDAAITYLQFALKDQTIADKYLKLFCDKTGTSMQYVQNWMPIAAAAHLTMGNEDEKEFLLRWIDVIDFQ